MSVVQELNDITGRDGTLRQTLTTLEGDLRDINSTLAQKRRQLENYLTSGFKGN